MKRDSQKEKGLFRRHRSVGGTLDRFEIALTSVGVAALRSRVRVSIPKMSVVPAQMLSDSVGLFSYGAPNE